MKPKIEQLLATLKHVPGVYIMYDIDDNIIYIGKAKDLYKRVSQYFLRPQVGKVMKMVLEAEYFKTIITNNEKEALVLEMNLIQTHYPKYNILLKDDRHYPYIALTKKKEPFLTIKRNKKDPNYTYYGPYPNATSAYDMISLLNNLFPIRKCKTLKKEVCLYYHMKTCLAPCVNEIDDKIHKQLRDDINHFLLGNNKNKYNEIKQNMIKASEEEKYELALEYKKLLTAIDHINEKQIVELKEKKSIDVFTFSIRDNFFSFSILLYREGRLLAKENHILELFNDEKEFFEFLISQYYIKHELPAYIIVSLEDVKDNLEKLFDTKILCPSKGDLFKLITTCKMNADNGLDEFFLLPKRRDDKVALLEKLGQILSIKTPLHIELFDNSHIQGYEAVGAMVCFINGEPVRGNYRKFNIRQDNKQSDYDNMKEVIYRHYSRCKNENKKLPDLLLVDGGISQINAASISLSEASVDIPLFGLYKDEKHTTKGIMDKEGKIYPLEDKNILFLLTTMQDEVHRYAIKFHKERRGKRATKSYLDGIKGVGQKRKEIIKKSFPTLSSLLNASEDELAQLIGPSLAKEVIKNLQK